MSGYFGDKEFVKKKGGHWVKVGKTWGLSVKAGRKKSRVFLVAHGAQPKVEWPPGGHYHDDNNFTKTKQQTDRVPFKNDQVIVILIIEYRYACLFPVSCMYAKDSGHIIYVRIRHSFAHVWTILNKMASFGVIAHVQTILNKMASFGVNIYGSGGIEKSHSCK